MSQSNRECVDRELEKLDGRLRPFIVRQMSLMYGASWQQEAQKSLHHPHWTKRGDLHLDLAALLHILWDQWESIFHQRLSPVEREIIKELLRARNDAFHQWPISDTKVERVLRNVEHLLTWIGPTDSFSQPPFTQANTTRSNPRPGTRTSPDWQDLPGSPGSARTSFLHLLEDKILDLPSSPRPARAPGQPRVSRRALLIIATGAVSYTHLTLPTILRV